ALSPSDQGEEEEADEGHEWQQPKRRRRLQALNGSGNFGHGRGARFMAPGPARAKRAGAGASARAGEGRAWALLEGRRLVDLLDVRAAHEGVRTHGAVAVGGDAEGQLARETVRARLDGAAQGLVFGAVHDADRLLMACGA